MSDVDVTPTEVRKMAGQLRSLTKAFEDLDADVVPNAAVSVSGDDRVAGKLNEFASNWVVRRADLAEQMSDLAGLAVDAADAYEHNEGDMAKGFEGGGARR
jgi:hypothetical protein